MYLRSQSFLPFSVITKTLPIIKDELHHIQFYEYVKTLSQSCSLKKEKVAVNFLLFLCSASSWTHDCVTWTVTEWVSEPKVIIVIVDWVGWIDEWNAFEDKPFLLYVYVTISTTSSLIFSFQL